MSLVPKSLSRPQEGRMVAGVCAGLARAMGADVQLVRAVAAIAVLVGGMGLWVYPVAWLLMPEEGSDRAGIDTLIDQAKDWNEQNRARKEQGAPSAAQPREVFDPYREPRA